MLFPGLLPPVVRRKLSTVDVGGNQDFLGWLTSRNVELHRGIRAMRRAFSPLFVVLPAAVMAFLAQPLIGSAETLPAPPSVRAIVQALPVEPAPTRPVVPVRAGDDAVPTKRRVGCEAAVSALAGQEARRLLPSRCLA